MLRVAAARRRVLVHLLCSVLLVLWPGRAAAAGRVLLAVGSNVGLEHEEPLSFGIRDAAEFSRIMQELGSVTAWDAHLVLNPTKQSFEGELVRVLSSLHSDSTLVVYYSGHGDELYLHVSGERVSRHWLEEKIATARARLRVVFVDACRGLKGRGFEPAAPFDASPTGYEGLVVVQSTGKGDKAFESQRLEGGLFTRHLLSGLRGAADTNEDGRVSLDEAYAFAHGHTLVDSGSAQIPARKLSITGSGTLDLTTVIETKSRLRLPAESSARYTVFQKGKASVFAEAWTKKEGYTELALPVGSFLVWRRARGVSAVAEFTTDDEAVRAVSEGEFVVVDDERMRERGGTLPLHTHRLSVTGGLVLSPRVDGGDGEGASAAIDYAWLPGADTWAPTVGLAFYRESFDFSSHRAERASYRATTGVLSPPLRWGEVAVRAGVGITASVTREKKERATGDGGSPIAPERSHFWRLGALLQLSVSVPVLDAVDWTVNLSANPTAFFERDTPAVGASGGEPTHLATSTAIFLATGAVFGF